MIYAVFNDAAIVLVLLLLVLVFAYGPVARTPLAGAIRVFAAFFVTLLGLGFTFGAAGTQNQVPIGSLLAAFGLTYFWVKLRKEG